MKKVLIHAVFDGGENNSKNELGDIIISGILDDEDYLKKKIYHGTVLPSSTKKITEFHLRFDPQTFDFAMRGWDLVDPYDFDYDEPWYKKTNIFDKKIKINATFIVYDNSPNDSTYTINEVAEISNTNPKLMWTPAKLE